MLVNQIQLEESSLEEEDYEPKCKCDHYEAVLNMNSLKINVLLKEESLILKIIDKIEIRKKNKRL